MKVKNDEKVPCSTTYVKSLATLANINMINYAIIYYYNGHE